MRPIIETKIGDLIFTIRLPENAQEIFFTRATLGHAASALVTGPLTGTGTGARAAPVPHITGAPQVPAPVSGGPIATRSPAAKIEYYRDEIRLLTAEKVGLTPAFDAHQAALKVNREQLRESHITDPAVVGSAVPCRLRLHDNILQSSIAFGRDARRYREVDGMIKTLSTEVERLLVKGVKK